MKPLILSLCLLSFYFQVSAQQPETKTKVEDAQTDFTVPSKNSWLDRFEKRQTKMIKLLNLTVQQKHGLDVLNDRFVTQRAIIQEDNSLNMRARTAELEVIRRERETNFRELLTESQLVKWNNLRKGQRKKTFRKK